MKNNEHLINIIQGASYTLKLMTGPRGGAATQFKRQVNDEIKWLKQNVKKLKRL